MKAGSDAVKLTPSTVEAQQPGDKRRIVWDSVLKGFGLRIEPTGRKVYVLRYRANGGGRGEASRDLTIGVHGELTPHEARKAAETALATVRLGGDPAGAKAARRAAKTFAQMVTHYLEDYAVTAALRPATVAQARQVLTAHALPVLGRMKVADIKPSDVRRVHAAASGKAGRYVANRTLAYTRKVLSLAVEEGERPDNPAKGVKAFPEDRRERYMSDAEAVRFFKALDALEDQRAADALRLLLLTGARLREVLNARFDQFDLEEGVWTKPSAHTKQKKLHRLVLDGPALAIVRGLRKADPFGAFLFPGRNGSKPRVDLKHPWGEVRTAADLKAFPLHALRHSFASFALSTGAPLAVVGRGLGHTQAATTQRYAHVADDAQRQSMGMVGRKLAALADSRPADVVDIAGKR
jgi:integrase